jgi:hypothetical protein
MKATFRVLHFILNFLPALSWAASDPGATQCIEKFLEANRKTSDYQAHLVKKEWDPQGGLLHDDQIEITVARTKKYVQLKYLNSGDSGVRNNGMKVEYSGTEKLKVKLGSANVLGFLKHSAASALIGDSISIFDSQALDGEIFTINRTGFDFLALILSKNLESAKTSSEGGFKLVTPGTCQVRYLPHISGKKTVSLQPADSIFDLEEKLGTLGYIILQENKDQFGSLRDVFVRQKPVQISVPASFYEVQFDLNAETDLLDRFQIFQAGQKIGDYQFSDVKKL